MGLFRGRGARKDATDLEHQIASLTARVAELEAVISVVDGRSSLNAERIVRTHSSLQNMAEDLDSTTKQVKRLNRRMESVEPSEAARNS